MAKKSSRNGKRAVKASPTKRKSKSKRSRKSNINRQMSKMSVSKQGFGPVSTINTAPVAIGNSLGGFKTQVIHTVNGCRMVGRDFCFAPSNTGSVTGWVLAGGMPVNPLVLQNSIARSASTMYAEYRLRAVTFHYITSSSTASTGDICFYVRKNEGTPLPAPTSNAFLPFILTDELTVLGPQWTNHSASVVSYSEDWLSTDLEATPDPFRYNKYDVFLYSKTSTTESPGYVIMDYDFEFRQLQLNPHAGIIASVGGNVGQWNQVAFTVNTNATAGTTVATIGGFSTVGIGATTISTPQNLVVGQVYELALDVTNTTLSAATAANFFQYPVAEVFTSYAIGDGQILYCVYDSSTVVHFYNTLASALSGSLPLRFGATVQYAEVLRGFWKCIYILSPGYEAINYF
jgi:hypothetical protein